MINKTTSITNNCISTIISKNQYYENDAIGCGDWGLKFHILLQSKYLLLSSLVLGKERNLKNDSKIMFNNLSQRRGIGQCVSYIKITFNERLLRKLHLGFKYFKFIAVLGSAEKFAPIPGRNTSILWDPLLYFTMHVQVTITVVFLTLFLSEALTC